MFHCSDQVKYFVLRFFFLSISGLVIQYTETFSLFSIKEENDCPFVETASFGSDINIKCNETYLEFNEINIYETNWRFANQTSFCHQKGQQQAAVHQCDITRIDSNYLKVPLKSIDRQESACAYCRINYKPIAPTITVTQSVNYRDILYKFNLTTTRLAQNQSFEILLVKRACLEMEYSLVYWFSLGCIDRSVNIIENTGQTIAFTVEDMPIGRVEFIIRYCNGNCREYNECYEDEMLEDIALKHFQTPDSIEKISCDEDCLNGIVNVPLTTTTTTITITPTSIVSSTMSFIIDQQIKQIPMLLPVLGAVLVLVLIVLGFFLAAKMKDARTRYVYTQASHQPPNEGTSSME